MLITPLPLYKAIYRGYNSISNWVGAPHQLLCFFFGWWKNPPVQLVSSLIVAGKVSYDTEAEPVETVRAPAICWGETLLSPRETYVSFRPFGCVSKNRGTMGYPKMDDFIIHFIMENPY